MALKMDGAKPVADTSERDFCRDLVGGRPDWAEAEPQGSVDQSGIDNPGSSNSKER